MTILRSLLTTLAGVVVSKQAGAILEAVFAVVFRLVALLRDKKGAGDSKYATALQAARIALDELLDDLPGWRKLTEAQRDQILGAIVELAVIVYGDEIDSNRVEGVAGTTKKKIAKAHAAVESIDLDALMNAAAPKKPATAKPAKRK
jgi:hypothetical protein